MKTVERFITLICICFTYALAQTTNHSGSLFNCPPLSENPIGSGQSPLGSEESPSSVHRLRPSDVKVIAGMGDSLTAGFAILSTDIQSLLMMPTDYRGLSWSAGGDSNLSYVTTLPNLLRQYNPDLYGYAEGTNPFGSENITELPNTRLNVARTGAGARDMLGQAQTLVTKMRESEEIDVDEDWKIITMLVGNNDLCSFPCSFLNQQGEPDTWIGDISNALNYLQTNLPRTFVNVVQLFNISAVRGDISSNSESGPICSQLFVSSCDCGTSIELLQSYNIQYQDKLEMLIGSGIYDTTDNFTVVLQPFQSNIFFNESDLSHFAADCIHLSPIGNRNLALGLWNNMLERVGEKSDVLMLPVTDITCPTDENPYFYTVQNSRMTTDSTPSSTNSGSQPTISSTNSGSQSTTSSTNSGSQSTTNSISQSTISSTNSGSPSTASSFINLPGVVIIIMALQLF